MRNALKQIRVLSGLTMKELGEKSGVSPSQICELEKETGNPTLKTACMIAKALNSKVYSIWTNEHLF